MSDSVLLTEKQDNFINYERENMLITGVFENMNALDLRY
jgi:hypothetical protein